MVTFALLVVARAYSRKSKRISAACNGMTSSTLSASNKSSNEEDEEEEDDEEEEEDPFRVELVLLELLLPLLLLRG